MGGRSNRWVVIVALLLAAHTSSAQQPLRPRIPFGPTTDTPAPAAPAPPTTLEEAATKREALRSELSAARRTADTATSEGAQAPEAVRREIALLERILLVLDQQESELRHLRELEESRDVVRSELESFRKAGPAEPRADSFLLLETTRSELAAHRARKDSVEGALQAAEAALLSARGVLEERERARRQAREGAETNTDETRAGALAVELRLAELESRLAREMVTLRELQVLSAQLAREVHGVRATLLSEKVDWIAERARFTQEDLDEQLARIAREEFSLRNRLEAARLDLDAATIRLGEARRQLVRSEEANPALTEEVEAERVARETKQLHVTLLGEQLSRLAMQQELWQRRFAVAGGEVTREETRAWIEAVLRQRSQLEIARELETAAAAEVRTRVLALRQKADTIATTSASAAQWIRSQIRRLEEQIAYYETSLASVVRTRDLADKLIAELRGPQSQTLGDFLEAAWETTRSIWRYEITSVDDRPITVGKIVVGVLVLVLGVFVSKLLVALVGRRVLPRLGLTEGGVAAVQSLVFYVLVLSFALLSLRVVNVPLTAFTLIGGALAIGIGFGSQNIMNNFISGLILLVERPIRVGDLIELVDLLGTVERIGLRSTRVRRSDNVEIIVPNSSFLEKNVTNWTLSDDRYRARVAVGVVYGSPVRDVTRLLQKVVDEHGKVLKKPEPIILFSDFGDNALLFEVHFWIRMRRLMDRRIVESDIRHRVDGMFREAGIVIAFPQRDVHLDTARPLEIVVRRPDGAAPDEEAPGS